MRPSFQRANEVYSYDPETGHFSRRIVTRGSKIPVGEVITTRDSAGYIQVSIDGWHGRGHQLAWLLMTGEWPENQVDHRDRDPSNNAWANLRAATTSQNLHNRSVRKDSASGTKGVHRTENGRFRVQIAVNGKTEHLGTYTTATVAAAVYAKAAKARVGEFARLK